MEQNGRKKASRGLLVTLLALTPVTAFYLMQLIMGTKLADIKAVALVSNGLWIAGLYCLLTALIGYPVISSLVVHLLSALWGMANYFINSFRGNPILPWDLGSLDTAAAVSGSYNIVLTSTMWFWLAVVVLCGVLLHKHLTWGRFRPTGKSFLPRVAGVVAGASLMFIFCQPVVLERIGVGAYTWQQMVGYCTDGALSAFFDNTKYMKVEEPEGATPENIQTLLSYVEDNKVESAAQGEEQFNIIAIMNESWADYEDYGTLTLSQSVTDYITSLDNAVWGHAYASVFGGGTSASEYEFLTGNSMAFLPSGSVPYQQFLDQGHQSMASILRDQGYRTLAFHPGDPGSWNRDEAYPMLGFQEVKFRGDMNVPQMNEHAYLSDYSDFQQIIWEFENKTPGEPMFLFNVTYQNHGGYEEPDYPTQVQVADCPGQYPKAEQYLTLANKTDEYFKVLVDYFSAYHEPTIIVMFGDHQPWLEPEFQDKAYGVLQQDMTMEQYMDRYKVPFVIWSNRPLDTENGPQLTSLNFLGEYVMRYAGVDGGVYRDFLWELQKEIPVHTFVGYMDSQGKAYSHTETNDYTKRIEAYKCLQYDRIFGIPKIS